MLEQPEIDKASLAAALDDAYGLAVVALTFLPLGADANSAVYRVDLGDGAPCFLKLRRGEFNPNTVRLPHFLATHGVKHLIHPLTSADGRLWSTFGAYTVTLYPFVDGRDGYTVGLSPQQWTQLGGALRGLHAQALPDALGAALPVWRDDATWRTRMTALLAESAPAQVHDALAGEAAASLQVQRSAIENLIHRAEDHAAALAERPLDMVICHGDIHAGNVLLTGDGALYVIDWDTVMLAPKERDLMFIGGGLMGDWIDPADEERLFYAGYGAADVDPVAIAYFRAMRILEDLVLYAEQLLHSQDGGEDRALALHYLESNFRPGATVDLVDRVPCVPSHVDPEH